MNINTIFGDVGIRSDNTSFNGTAITNVDIANDINATYSGATINNSGSGGTSVVNFNSKASLQNWTP